MGIKTIGRFVYDTAPATPVAANSNVPIPTSTVSTPCVSCDGSNITIEIDWAYGRNQGYDGDR